MAEGEYIPVSKRYERDMDLDTTTSKRKDTVVFDEGSNDHFIYTDAKSLVDTEQGRADLVKMITEFTSNQVPRLEVLDSYSNGQNSTIMTGRRRMEEEKADYRIRHNWGKYISSFITGYVLGEPVTITTADETDDETINPSLAEVRDINGFNNIDTTNYELGYDASRFGRAFELHYRGSDSRDHIAIIDPREIFAVRDTTVEQNLLCAVHIPKFNGQYYATVYTDNQIITYKPFNDSLVVLTEDGRKPNPYGTVPVVEWWNNRFRQGDYETEIPLIDAYDSAQSDTANYMSDLNDAMLVIKGDISADGAGLDDYVKMKQANMLLLENGVDASGKQTSVDAGYIYKQYDVHGTEAYKTRLINDLYKLSHVPNLDDDRFYSGQSGVALQYKMIGLEQIRITKQAFYTRALRRRYEIINNIHAEINDQAIDYDDLVFTFHPNIPRDTWEEIERYVNVGGTISQETLRENTTFTTHTGEENRLQEESFRPDDTDAYREWVKRE